MAKNTEVLMFGWEFPPALTGGVGMACYGLTRHLALENIKITFVLPYIAEEMRHFFLEVVDGSSFLKNIHTHFQQDNRKDRQSHSRFSYEHLTECIELDALLTPYSSSEFYRKILTQYHSHDIYGEELLEEVERYALIGLEVAANRSFDIIHVHDWISFPVGIAVKQKYNKPLVVHLHTSEYDRNHQKPNAQVVDIEQMAFDVADKIIVVSHGLKKLVCQNYKVDESKVEVVYNAIERGDTVDFDSDIEFLADKKVVFFLGRITSQKGPMLFLDAAEKILQQRKDIVFVMAGDGDMARHVIAECHKRELQDFFFFPGHLKSAEKEKLFAVSDLYVLPSLAEPFGITPAEVMQYDIPILMTEGLAAKEIIPEAQEFSFNDPNDLAKKVIQIIDSPQLQQDIVRNYQKNLDRLDWKCSALKVMFIYDQLLDQTV